MNHTAVLSVAALFFGMGIGGWCARRHWPLWAVVAVVLLFDVAAGITLEAVARRVS